ncbi:hypothetical protein AB0H73_09360 [Streptomyces olivoreticuli]
MNWAPAVLISVLTMVMVPRALQHWVRKEFAAALRAVVAWVIMSSALAWTPQIAGWLTKRLRGGLLIGDGQEGPAQKPAHTGAERGFDSIPWDTVLLVAGAIAGTAVVLLVAWAMADGIRDRRRRAMQASTRLADLKARHDAVRDAYGEFETNLLDNLDRLALAYVTVPQTADFIDALDAARDARIMATAGQDLEPYRKAVLALENAFRTADHHARQVGTSFLAPPARSSIERAQYCLATATANSATEHERRVAAQRAIEVVKQVVPDPTKAVAALEKTTRLGLEAS